MHFFILITRRNDQYIIKILGSTADQRNTPNINFLNYIFFASTFCNGLFKGIEIDNNQINRPDAKFLSLFYITTIFSSIKNPSKNGRVQCFNSSSENGREAR